MVEIKLTSIGERLRIFQQYKLTSCLIEFSNFFGAYKMSTIKLIAINVAVVIAALVAVNFFHKVVPTPTVDLIKNAGYDVENHQATTKDGYILGIQRILPKNKAPNRRPPFLLMHGLTSSSADYISYLGNASLPYRLVEAGFDVWLGNGRGAPESRGHVRPEVATDPARYWNFTIHELGYYDLPAMIDRVLQASGRDELFYGGYSQGGMILFVMTSTRPEYNRKIQHVTLLSPIVPITSVDRHTQAIHRAAKFWPSLQRLNGIGFSEVPGNSVIRNICSFLGKFPVLIYFCSKFVLEIYAGLDPSRTDMKIVPEIFRNFPADTGLKNIVHFLQCFDNKKFGQYDHGRDGNLKVYGVADPPTYDVASVTPPIAYYHGKKDTFVTIEDAQKAASKIKNLDVLHIVPLDEFGHLDVLVTNDVGPLLYDSVIKNVKKYYRT